MNPLKSERWWGKTDQNDLLYRLLQSWHRTLTPLLRPWRFAATVVSICNVLLLAHLSLSSRITCPIFYQTWHKESLCTRKGNPIQICSNERSYRYAFISSENNSKMGKQHYQLLKVFSSRISWANFNLTCYITSFGWKEFQFVQFKVHAFSQKEMIAWEPGSLGTLGHISTQMDIVSIFGQKGFKMV